MPRPEAVPRRACRSGAGGWSCGALRSTPSASAHADLVRQRSAGAHTELPHRSRDLFLHGVDRDEELLGDLLVGQAGGSQHGHLALAGRQLVTVAAAATAMASR